MLYRRQRWITSTVVLCCLLVATAFVGSTTQLVSVSAAQADASLPPELTAAPANTTDFQVLAGAQVDWFTTLFSSTISFSRWTLPPGTQTENWFRGLGLIWVESGELVVFDSAGPGEYPIDPAHPLLLQKDDQNNYTVRNDSDQCASLLYLNVDALEGAGGGGGGTFTDEDGPRLAAEAPCGTEAEQHVIVHWQEPFAAAGRGEETFTDGPLYVFIARKTIQPDRSTGSHSYTGPVGMYVEDGLLWLPDGSGSEMLLSAGGLQLIPAGSVVQEQSSNEQSATALVFGVVSANSEPGPLLTMPRQETGLSDSGKAYRSPTYPFSLSWNYSWVVTGVSDQSLLLTNGRTNALFLLSTARTDPQTCVADEAHLASVNSETDDYVVAQNADKEELAGVTMNGRGYFGIYISPTQRPVHYIECFSFDDNAAMLTMHVTVDYNDYANEAPALDELRSRINLDD